MNLHVCADHCCLSERYRSHVFAEVHKAGTSSGNDNCTGPSKLPTIEVIKKDITYDVPAGLVVGCRKVKELVPKVRLARFHRESLPSRLGFPGGGEIEAEADASSDGEG